MGDERLRNNAYINDTAGVRLNTIANSMCKLFKHTGIASTLIFQVPITDQDRRKQICMFHQGDEADLMNAAISGMCERDVLLKRYDAAHMFEDDPEYYGGVNQRVNGLDDLPDISACITDYRRKQQPMMTEESKRRGTMQSKFAARINNANSHIRDPSWDLIETLERRNGAGAKFGGRLNKTSKRKRSDSTQAKSPIKKYSVSKSDVLKELKLAREDGASSQENSTDDELMTESISPESVLKPADLRAMIDKESLRVFYDSVANQSYEEKIVEFTLV